MPTTRLSLARIARETLRTWRRHARYLWGLAAVVVLPLAVAELLGIHARVRITTESFDLADLALGFLLLFGVQLAGEELFAGACEEVMTADDRGEEHARLVGLARRLPLGRMIGASLVYSALVVAGLFLFIVPGVVAAAWFAVVGPIIVRERRGIFNAFTRSRELVRGHFWVVLAYTIIITVALDLAAGLVAAAVYATGAPHQVGIVAGFATEVFMLPFSGVGTVVVYRDLLRLAPASGRDTGPRGAGP